MNFRNASIVNDDVIFCEIEHPVAGWIPFAATSDDPEEYGRELYLLIKRRFELAEVFTPLIETE